MNKYKKQLKKFGMEKEFQEWLDNIKKQRKGFDVGSRVELTERLPTFNLWIGDKGTVKQFIRFKDPMIRVEFDKTKEVHDFYTSRFRLI